MFVGVTGWSPGQGTVFVIYVRLKIVDARNNASRVHIYL